MHRVLISHTEGNVKLVRLLGKAFMVFIVLCYSSVFLHASTSDTSMSMDSNLHQNISSGINRRPNGAANHRTEVVLSHRQYNELNRLRANDSLRMAALLNEVLRLKENGQGYPVLHGADTLFFIYTRNGSLDASERAELITKRLAHVYKQYNPATDTLEIFLGAESVDVRFQNKVLISITALDALWYGKEVIDIALDFKNKFEDDLTIFHREKGLVAWLKEIGLALLILLFQIVVIRFINILFRGKLSKLVWDKRGIWFKGIRIKNYELIDQNRETSAVVFFVKVIRYVLILLMLYITLPVLFSIFPPTRRLAELLFGYVLTPLRKIALSVLNYIPELITIIVIVVLTRYVLKFLKYLTSEIENDKLRIPGFFPDWAKPTYNIVKVLVLAFMFILIFPYLPGSDSPVFKGVSVFLGIVFSLGSSSIIGNMVAGLVITYMRPFQIGDRIKIGEILGDVVEKTPFVTRLRTPKKEYITIPNSNILASSVVNYSTSKNNEGIILYSTVTIGYDVPWRQVHELLIGAALQTSYIKDTPKPFVLQTSLDDFYVSYQVNAYTNHPDKQPIIYSVLHQNIQDAFNEAGIEIMSPHYRAERDGNGAAIPEGYRTSNKLKGEAKDD